MTTETQKASPTPLRHPVDPSITEEQISNLVESFYGEVQKDERLGPIFATRVDGDWGPHLDRMKSFWRSILLRSGEYKGQPLPIHLAIEEMQPEDFGYWLDLFRPAVRQSFEKNAAEIVIELAERIAQSLWLGQFAATPSTPYPDWLKERMAT